MKTRDANDFLQGEGDDGLRGRIDHAGPPQDDDDGAGPPRLLSKQEFLAGFVPPDYLVDGVLQRRFIYSLTAVTGHGKTALALNLARVIACLDLAARFGPHAVENGRVIYFVGENPDDVRCRIIGDDSTRNDDLGLDRIHFIAGVFDFAGLRQQLMAMIGKIGGVDLVIVDTSAAYFLKDDENSNSQIGEHARNLRALTGLPGSPCVVVLCHPIKHVTDPSQLMPRGGGSFLAAMDGNLTLWKHDENLATLHHSDKWRGPGFEPITFRLEKITTEKLVDSKGRQIPTVHAVAISEAEEEEEAANAERDEDVLMAVLASSKRPRSIADLAHACSWRLANGEPHKSKVDRVMRRLKDDQLIRRVRGRKYQLTDKGCKELGLFDDDDDDTARRVEDRGGAPGNKPFHALRGMKQRDTVPCAFCGKTGDVYKFADGRLPKGQRHHADLHEGKGAPRTTSPASRSAPTGIRIPPNLSCTDLGDSEGENGSNRSAERSAFFPGTILRQGFEHGEKSRLNRRNGVPWKHADLSMRLPGSYRSAQIPIGERGTERPKKRGPPRGVPQGPRTGRGACG